MKKILILENKSRTRRRLTECIQNFGYELFASCRSLVEFRQAIRYQQPDLALLDIHLSSNDSQDNIDGILAGQLLHINQQQTPIIYLTAYANQDHEQTVQELLLTHPCNILHKPCEEYQLALALRHALSSQVQEETHISIPNNGMYERICIKDIKYLKAEGAYSVIATKHTDFCLGRNLKHSLSLIEAISLQQREHLIIKTHRSYAVNRTKITKVAANYSHLFIGETKIPISRCYRTPIKNLFS